MIFLKVSLHRAITFHEFSSIIHDYKICKLYDLDDVKKGISFSRFKATDKRLTHLCRGFPPPGDIPARILRVAVQRRFWASEVPP